jgi:hypothetical protein
LTVDSGQPGAYDLESGGAGSVCARGPLSRVGGVGPALVSGVGRADDVILFLCHGDVASAFASRVVLLVHVFGSVGMLLLIGVPHTSVCGGNDLRGQ